MRHLRNGWKETVCVCVCVCVCVVRGPLTVVASPIAEHRLRTRRLSGHGSRAQPLRGTWDLPGPGHEPASHASVGGLSTTAPPGKPFTIFFNLHSSVYAHMHIALCNWTPCTYSCDHDNQDTELLHCRKQLTCATSLCSHPPPNSSHAPGNQLFVLYRYCFCHFKNVILNI